MGKSARALKNIFPFSRKKVVLAAAGFVFMLSLFSYFPNIQTANSNNKKAEEAVDAQGANLSKIQGKKLEPLLKLHLLQRAEDNSNQNKEPRNIFLPQQHTQSSSRLQESILPGVEKPEPFLSPPFPYKVIGKVRFHKSAGFEDVAIVFNGFSNVFVKEGEMIDPNFKLIRINEDDVDIQYSGQNEIIKIEIKGN